jgi:hypothetical protein
LRLVIGFCLTLFVVFPLRAQDAALIPPDSTTSRVPFVLPTPGLLLVTAFAPTKTSFAQRPSPLGVTAHSPPISKSVATRGDLRSREPGTWQQRSFWNWTGLGILLGGVAGGIWAGVQIAHSDDPMLANAAIVIGVGGGAITGGLLGALTYSIYHSPRSAQWH